MNFLAHLVLAGNNDALRLGALLGDFVRGKQALQEFSEEIQLGIMLHRRIDGFSDALPEITRLRGCFEPPFRRYSGIIIDVACDYELARRWADYSEVSLEEFDLEVRGMLARNDDLLPDGLRRFMSYADRRGLFAAYREKSEILHSLTGVGRRLSRPNPLHRVGEIWDGIEPRFEESFEFIFSQVQSEVSAWLKSKSTITGS